MIRQQIGPTKFETTTESRLVKVETPVMGEEFEERYPKVEVEAGVEVAATFQYRGQTVEAKIKASGKGKFGILFRLRRKTTTEWWEDVTYQREVKVMGQMIGWVSFDAIWSKDPLILLEACVDWMEPDEVGPWKEVGRSQPYKKDRVEFEVISTSLYDPPEGPAGGAGGVLELVEGALAPVVDSFEGPVLEVVAGTFESTAAVLRHKILIDGTPMPAAPLPVGSGLLSEGRHVATIEAETDAGAMSFPVPLVVASPLSIDAPAPPERMQIDERRKVEVVLTNRSSQAVTVQLNCGTRAAGWGLFPPVNPVRVPARGSARAEVEVHAYPADDSAMKASVEITAISLEGSRAQISFAVEAVIPISHVRELERRFLTQLRHGPAGGAKNYYFS